MKKFVAILVALIFTVFLTACGSASPSDTVDTFLQAVKAQNTDTISSSYAGDSFDMLSEAESDSDDDLDNMLESEVMSKLTDFDYTISNEVIDGDTATVDVTFQTYEIGSAVTNFMSSYLTQALTMAFSGGSDEELETLGENLLKTELEKLTEKTYEQTVTITLTKKDDVWTINEFADDDPIFNAITGGLVDAVAQIEEDYSFDE